MERRYLPPQPEVQHLPTIFRRVQTGAFRIPAFQRGFVWKQSQVIELLESVYRGFPIGSLLFWKVDSPVLRVDRSGRSPFPDLPEQYPINYVLDGLQRLSALYGVFHHTDRDTPSLFNVVFDLGTETFRHYEPELDLHTCIRLSALFSPKDFLDSQQRLASSKRTAHLLDKAVELHAAFQEYMIPTVTLSGRPVEQVVEIFQRINNTGVKLNAVDFMRAVTWSEDFDLNNEMRALQRTLAKTGFQVTLETMVKALGVILGKDPTPSSMLTMRTDTSSRLLNAAKRTGMLLQQSLEFLRHSLLARSMEFVPYEGQILALVKFFSICSQPTAQQARELRAWLWATAFNESLRGKPDHYVVRMLGRAAALAGGASGALEERLTISQTDFIERRLIRGKALSGAFVCMLAARGARSLLSGYRLPPDEYLKEFSSRSFHSLISRQQLFDTLGVDFPSARVLANTVLVTPSDRAYMTKSHLHTVASDILGARLVPFDVEEVLESQLIPLHAAELLLQGDYMQFLELRADALYEWASRLCDPNGKR